MQLSDRAAEKERSRQHDIARLDSGEISADALSRENGFLSALNLREFRIVAIGKRRLKNGIIT